MNLIKSYPVILAITIYGSLCGPSANAQEVSAQLSEREAYVGMPIVLQISIRDASDYDLPEIPPIDGCDVRATGGPSKSSRITIINGRRSESQSITMQYLVTPRRAGSFEIPALQIKVDGKNRTTQPLRFVATKSETGDLLFVEIEGGKEKVYVGEPLDLKLKIWIKPFRDRQQRITLSESQMWQLLERQSSWGAFLETLQELADNGQRPRGREVLRDDGRGNQRSYYLYEIDATVYPTRPGRIDASDVTIVVNYPTALGRSRDPFGDVFRDSPFGSNSLLKRMMNDDFFASPFGNRLTVSASRPVVAEAAVDSTEVVPVPLEGRPADYRGAVGNYRIATQAAPTSISAGDPIELHIGISGTGPMELVQAPPLAALPELTADFKVPDRPLPGYVQESAKVFSTDIRPRRAGIAQIPAIPFSFFDPTAESFKTVYSEPISISVGEAETLALDAIVGHTPRNRADDKPSQTVGPTQPDFTNITSTSVLNSRPRSPFFPLWWVSVVVPPLIWLIISVWYRRHWLTAWIPSFRSALARGLAGIDRAPDREAIRTSLVRYVASRTGIACTTASQAVGALRTAGLHRVAIELESLFDDMDRKSAHGDRAKSRDEFKVAARNVLSLAEEVLAKTADLNVARVSRSEQAWPQSVRKSRRLGPTALMLVCVGGLLPSPTFAQTPSTDISQHQLRVQLSELQQIAILEDANQAYARATKVSSEDAAEAHDAFTEAAHKYQLLVDSGIQNDGLYFNLGNAYLQSGQLGRAIANYQRGHDLNPKNRQLFLNLRSAQAQVRNASHDQNSGAEIGGPISWRAVMETIYAANRWLVAIMGPRTIIAVVMTSSLLFWGLMIARTVRKTSSLWRLAMIPLLVLLVSLASVGLSLADSRCRPGGIVVADNLTLREADGDHFETVATVEQAQGLPVEILGYRGTWVQLKTASGVVGWTSSSTVTPL